VHEFEPHAQKTLVGNAVHLHQSTGKKIFEYGKDNEMNKVVVLRHGESVWNEENRFTGWTDGINVSGASRHERFFSLLRTSRVFNSHFRKAMIRKPHVIHAPVKFPIGHALCPKL
jgi:hypothetical protein